MATGATIEAVGGWTAVLSRLVDGDDLDADMAGAALRSVLAGEADPAQIAGLVVGLVQKGESVDEVVTMVDVMLEAAAPLSVPPSTIDIVGTGGSARRRQAALNVSTMASLVAAAAGATVCKHGNRRASSTSGSFDLLDELGVGIEADPDLVERSLTEIGLAFAFARTFHPAMRHAGPVRAALGIPTVFNILGPLSHPGRIDRQVVGVASPERSGLVAGVLAARGVAHALVVHGRDGLDEISVSAPTDVIEICDGRTSTHTIGPADFDLTETPADQMPGGSPADNAALARGLLAGDDGPVRDIVTLNAGAGLYVAGVVDDIGAGVVAAAAAIDDGRAQGKLEALVEITVG